MANLKPIALDSDRPAWEMQSEETEEAFARFVEFRDLGLRRKLRTLVDAEHQRRKLEGPLTDWNEITAEEEARRYNNLRVTWSQIATRYQWNLRARAYDREEDRVRVEENMRVVQDRVRQAANLQYGLASRLIVLASRGLERFLADNEDGKKRVGDLTVNDLINLAKSGTGLQRTALGLDDGTNQNRESNDPLPERDVTPREELKRIAVRAAAAAADEYADDPPDPEPPTDDPDEPITTGDAV